MQSVLNEWIQGQNLDQPSASQLCLNCFSMLTVPALHTLLVPGVGNVALAAVLPVPLSACRSTVPSQSRQQRAACGTRCHRGERTPVVVFVVATPPVSATRELCARVDCWNPLLSRRACSCVCISASLTSNSASSRASASASSAVACAVSQPPQRKCRSSNASCPERLG